MPTAIITGAARGIGRAAAEVFAAAGYDLIINCRTNFDLLDALAEQLNKRVHCIAVHGAITEEILAARLNTEAVCGESEETQTHARAYKPELVLINNAGISRTGLLQDVSDAEWDEMLEANLGTMFRTTRAVIPYMLRRQGGCILNVSSVWGCVGASCEVVYSMTKGGINAFTRALAKELAPSCIAVNALACGTVDTDMNAWLSEEERLQLADEIPAGRMARPEEVAAFLLQLAEAPSYLSGQVIRFDGAWI